MPLEDQQAFLHILLLGFLETEFQEIEFMKSDYVNKKLNKMTKGSP